MKIAIITFSDFNTNYGSMLQALSLKMQIEKLGHNVEFIRYREFNKPPQKIGIKENSIFFIKNIALKMIAFANKNRIKKTEGNFEKFRKDYFKHTELFTSNESLKSNLDEYDCYICGSDQIWNIDSLGGLRKPYFLDFAPDNKIKIAYAPSMGNFQMTNKDLKGEIKKLLQDLDWISVREKENVKVIQELTEKPVISVVDPVFLTSEKEWQGLLPKGNVDKPYGVCYFVTRSRLGKRLVKKLQKKYNMPIYNLSDNLVRVNGTSNEFVTVDPLAFLALIKNAKFVVGTSFHLAAFSIIFKVPFLIAGMESNRNRLLNILDLVNRKESYITENTDLDLAVGNILEQKFNSNKLIEAIASSRQFLIKAMGGRKNA